MIEGRKKEMIDALRSDLSKPEHESFVYEIKPLIAPTRQIMKIGVKSYDWHELFPKGNIRALLLFICLTLSVTPASVKSNAGAIAAVWAPIILIWYSVFCSIFGGVYGILHHLGENKWIYCKAKRHKRVAKLGRH